MDETSRHTGAKASSPVTLSDVGSSDAAGNAIHLFTNRSGRWGCGSCAYETLCLDLSPGQAMQAFLEYAFQVSIHNPRVRPSSRQYLHSCTRFTRLTSTKVQTLTTTYHQSDEWLLPQPHALLAPLTISTTCGSFSVFPPAPMQVARHAQDGVWQAMNLN